MVRRWIVSLGAAAAFAMALAACGQDDTRAEVARGREAFVDYGCVACHAVSGVRTADGRVGPRLDGFASQRIIAGKLPNNRPNLVRWIQDP